MSREIPIYEQFEGNEFIHCGDVSVLRPLSSSANIKGFIDQFQADLTEDLKQKLVSWLDEALKRESEELGLTKRPQKKISIFEGMEGVLK